MAGRTLGRRITVLVAVGVLLAAVLVAVRGGEAGERLARTAVGWGLPLPGWCVLDIDAITVEGDVEIRDARPVVLSDDEARALLDRAVDSTPDSAADAVPAAWAAALGLPGRLACSVRGAGAAGREQMGEQGLTPRAQRLRAEVEARFTDVPDGGYVPGGVTGGRVRGSAHYDGRAIDWFFRPVGDEAQRARGWLLAHWLVAHAERLEVATVIFDDRIWTARRSMQGWRAYRHPSGDTVNPVLRHLDHVHVDVVRGSS